MLCVCVVGQHVRRPRKQSVDRERRRKRVRGKGQDGVRELHTGHPQRRLGHGGDDRQLHGRGGAPERGERDPRRRQRIDIRQAQQNATERTLIALSSRRFSRRFPHNNYMHTYNLFLNIHAYFSTHMPG